MYHGLLGVTLALIGIIQKATFNGKIYGFWTTQMGGTPFGPFVNKNHFAGWMLMALPLTIALLCAGIARGMVYVRPTFRDRVVWFGSRDASELVMLAAAAAVMALSLVLTMSRSGMLSFLVAIAVAGAFVLFGVRAKVGKSVAGLYLVGLVVLVAAWVGVDAIAARFAQIDHAEFRERPEAWADAWAIAKRFSLTGTGLNTYGVATLFFQEHQLGAHYVQAHNDYLQLLAEGGLLVAIPAVGLLVAFVRQVRRRFREGGQVSLSSWWARAGAVTGLVAIGLQSIVDFSLQMPGNAALFAVLVAVALHRAPERRRPTGTAPEFPASPPLLCRITPSGILPAVPTAPGRNIYFELTEAFNRLAPTVVLASGQAVVYHRVAIMSKDGDWIIRETREACDRVLDELEARGARYRPAAPLDIRWLKGGWSSHFEFFDAGRRRIRCDFFSRPPRVPAPVINALFDAPPALNVVDVPVLIAMKQTQRAKDYPIIGELATRLTPQEEIIVTTDPDRIIALAPDFGEASRRASVRAARHVPLDRSAVVAALAEEVDGLRQRDRKRVAAYEAAAGPYLEACRTLDLSALGLRAAHARMLEMAERLLPDKVDQGPDHANAQ